MEYEVEFTDEFGEWWTSLSEDEQVSVDAGVKLLEMKGPHLPSPILQELRAPDILTCES